MPFTLRLAEDRFEAGARYPRPLPALDRVLYVWTGELAVRHGGADVVIAADTGWHGAGEVGAAAGPAGATVLRYELLAPGSAAAAAAGPGVASRVLLEHPIDLDPAEPYLMRNDRVDFDPGGEALPHGHKGGGIRCLIAGTLEVRVGDRPATTMKPGDAWFESGREPVHAVAARDVPTSFIRVSILPGAVRGASSIVYVDPAAAARSKPRKYTVYVDEPITLSWG